MGARESKKNKYPRTESLAGTKKDKFQVNKKKGWATINDKGSGQRDDKTLSRSPGADEIKKGG